MQICSTVSYRLHFFHRITCCVIIFIILAGKARIDGLPESRRTLVSELGQQARVLCASQVRLQEAIFSDKSGWRTLTAVWSRAQKNKRARIQVWLDKYGIEAWVELDGWTNRDNRHDPPARRSRCDGQ